MDRDKRSVIIFGSGPLFPPMKINEYLRHADLIIAADGGANHCAYLDILPDYVIGDLDSIEPQLLGIYKETNTHIIRYPREKDATDLELAFELAMDEGATDVYLFGVLGNRWDMSIANIMLAASTRYKTIKVLCVSDDSIITLLHPGLNHLFIDKQKKTVSFIPLGSDVLNVTLEGFAYPLKNETLPFGSSRGVSNIITENQATEKHQTGILLCVEHI